MLVIFTLMVLWSDMGVAVEYGQGYKSIAMCDGNIRIRTARKVMTPVTNGINLGAASGD